MSPIRARNPLPQVGQKWVYVKLSVLVALALHAARFCSAWRDLCSSAVWAPSVIRWRQEGLFEAADSQDTVLMEKSFRETFRLSLKRFPCPPTLRLPSQSSRGLPISAGPCT